MNTYTGQEAAYVFSIKDSKIISTQAFSNKGVLQQRCGTLFEALSW